MSRYKYRSGKINFKEEEQKTSDFLEKLKQFKS